MRSRVIMAVAVFVVYTAVATGVGLGLFTFTDVGTETKTTTQLDSGKKVTGSTVETSVSTAALVVFTALAAGGWLLIPLRFAWDELAKSADDRRATWTTMRGIVFEGISTYWGTMLYHQRSIAGWAQTCLDQKKGGGAVTGEQRLLFAIGVLEERYDAVRQAGKVILLKTLKAEHNAALANIDLQRLCNDLLGADTGADAELLRAVATGAAKGHDVISYAVFEERLASQGHQWQKLRTLSDAFKSRCEDEAMLTRLRDAAQSAYEALRDGINQVYEDWYPDAHAKVPPIRPTSASSVPNREHA